MDETSLQDRLDNMPRSDFKKSDLLHFIPFYNTYHAAKHGFPSPLFTKREAVKYAIMQDFCMTAMYAYMALVVYKGIVG